MIALRINDFCRGNSGLRLETIQMLADPAQQRNRARGPRKKGL